MSQDTTDTPTWTPNEIRAAWAQGNLGYRMRNVQKMALSTWEHTQGFSRKFYLEANRRFGKSSFFLMLQAERRIQTPGSKGGFYAPVKEGLRDYVVPIISKTFEDCPDDLKPVLDSHLTLNFPNGSTIIFRGSNNQQHRVRRGNDLQDAVIDEGRDVDDLQELIDSVVIPSLFTSGGFLLLGSTPADTDDHDLHGIMLQAQREGWMDHYDIIECSKHDPDDFPLDRIEQWKKETTDSTAWEREYMARWVKDPTKVIIPEWEDKYVLYNSARTEYFPFYHKYVGLDTGVRDKTVGLLGYYDFHRAALVIESEFVLHDAGVRTDNIAKLIKSKEEMLGYQKLHERSDPLYNNQAMHERMHRRVADNDNLILVNDLNASYGLDFYATRKDELEAMINQVRLWVQAGRILVDKSCVELIGCLRNAIWDKNKTELARSKVYGHFDGLMALVYLVRNIDTSTNPVPEYYGKSWVTHSIPVVPPEPSSSAMQLARVLRSKTTRDSSREQFVRGGG